MTLWNFDLDSLGVVPSGWTLASGSAKVQNDWAYSLPNSFRFDPSIGYAAQAFLQGISIANGTISLRMRSNRASDEQHIIFRRVSDTDYYEVRHRTGMNTRLYKMTGPESGSLIKESSVNRGVDVDFNLLIEFDGIYCRVFVDGVEIIPFTDLNYNNQGAYIGPAYTGVGEIGVRTAFTTGNVFAWVDDFEVISSEAPAVHPLTVSSTPITGIQFTIDGITYLTYYSGELVEGSHVLVFPASVTVGGSPYRFVRSDGVTTRTRTINLISSMDIEAVYELGEPQEGCFIATAVMGTEYCGELDTLRSFRDKRLKPWRVGNRLVELYYRISPPLAEYIRPKSKLRQVIRRVLIEPAVRLSGYLLE